jgi:hypothetical protein
MRIHHVWKLVAICIFALASLSGMTGCTGGGSGSGSSGGGTAGQPQLVTLQVSDPVCPVSGTTNVWNVFSNNLAPLEFPISYLASFCDLRSDPFLVLTNILVQLQINTSTNVAIDHYTWEIIPPTDATLAGSFLLGPSDFLTATGSTRIVVQSPNNTITYLTPIVGRVYGLDLPITVTIIATAFSPDGRFTSGTFALNLQRPPDAFVSPGGLSSSSQGSHANPATVANYTQVKGVDAQVIAIVATNGNCVYFYDVNLTNTQNQCDNTGIGYTLITASLLDKRPYYLEVTPNANNILGGYFLIGLSDRIATNPGSAFFGPLTSPSNPWNPRSQGGWITGFESLAQTNTDFPFYADYYKLTGGATVTLNATFTPPPNAIVPGGTNGVVSVYTNGNPTSVVSPVGGSQNRYFLTLGQIYYVEVASFVPTNTVGSPFFVNYTITVDNGTMLPTISPFP